MYLFGIRCRAAAAIILFALAGCGSGVPQLSQKRTASAAAQCTPPVKTLQVMPVSLTLTAENETAKLTACTQFFSTYRITSSPSGVVSVPSSVTPTQNSKDAPYTASIPVTALNDGTATVSVTDKKQNEVQVTLTVAFKPLFVANQGNNTVTEYAAPYTGAPVLTISNSLSGPAGVGFDSSGNLFVANSTNSTVTEYAPPYNGSPVTTITSGVGTAEALALDSSNDVFVANSNNNNVTEYAPPYSGSPITISNSVSSPMALAFDANGNLFVANFALNGSVTEYAPPYTGAPIATISGIDEPDGLAFDSSGNLFVAEHETDTVAEYASPYTGSPIATFTISQPGVLAFDAANNLFVGSFADQPVSEYAPPYTGSPTTISNGISAPEGLTLGP